MRTIPLKKRSMLRTLQRRSGLHVGLDSLTQCQNFSPADGSTIVLSHCASTCAQRFNFLRAHHVPRWDGPKQTSCLEIAFGLVLLRKAAKKSLNEL